MTGHDQLFKDLLRSFFPDLVRLLVPEIAARLDLGRAVFLDKELFTDLPAGRRREPDLVARVPRRDDPGEAVLVHVEVEATARPSVPKRLWRYSMQLALRHGLAVLSILVALRRARPGVHRETLRVTVLDETAATFHYVAIGLENGPAEEWLARPEPLAWALAALMRPKTSSRPELKLACLRRIAEADLPGLDEAKRFLLVNCVETYLQLQGDEAAQYEAARAREEVSAVRVVKLKKTWAEQMQEEIREQVEGEIREQVEGEIRERVEGEIREIRAHERTQFLRQGRAEGLKEGQARGLQRGLELGRTENARQLLLRLLKLRFGALPEGTVERIEKIESAELLNRLAEQVVTAGSLAELDLD